VLRIVIRDVDAPDHPIEEAAIIVASIDTSAGTHPAHRATSNDRGLVPAIGLDTGEYSVWVRRVGYHEVRFAVHVRPSCEQILEVYVTRNVVQLDRCMVVTAGRPPCDPDPRPTPSRAVFTTCARVA
jgi:hypothetical protein